MLILSDGNVHFVLDSALASTGINFDSITTADAWRSAAETLAVVRVTGVELEVKTDSSDEMEI